MCYGKYLGKLVEIGSRPRDPDAGAAGQSSAPVYVFEHETFDDIYPSPVCLEVERVAVAATPSPQSEVKVPKKVKSKPIITD